MWVNSGSDNGLSPGRRRAIIWTNADILSIRTHGTYFNDILFEIQIFFQENAFEHVVCEKGAILSRRRLLGIVRVLVCLCCGLVMLQVHLSISVGGANFTNNFLPQLKIYFALSQILMSQSRPEIWSPSAMVTTSANSLIMWSFKGPKLCWVLWNLLEMK